MTGEADLYKCSGILLGVAPLVGIVLLLTNPPLLFAQDDNLAVAQRLSMEAEQLEVAERYQDAIPLLEKALTIYESLLGPTNPSTSAARGRLGALYLSSGAFREGEALFRQKLAIEQQVLGAGDPTRTLLSGRAFLLPNSQEPTGYGLHSYLLLESPPKNETERNRYLKALQALLSIMQPMEELERHKPRSELNITLVPLKHRVKHPASLSAEQVLEEYDYSRAKVLFASHGREVLRGGPYFLSRKPGVGGGKDTVHLFLDMSHVAPDLVFEWTRSFSWLAAGERSWSEVTLRKLALNTRNAIAISARNVPLVMEALEQWIQVGQSTRQPSGKSIRK